MNFNVTVFRGGDVQYTLRRFRMYENDNVMLPDGSYMLASEVVVEKSTGELQVEVWAAVPNHNMSVANGTRTVSDPSDTLEEDTLPPQSPQLVKLQALKQEYEAAIVTDDEIEDLYDPTWTPEDDEA